MPNNVTPSAGSAMIRAQNLACMRAISRKLAEGAEPATILTLLRIERMGVEQKRIPNRPRPPLKRFLISMLQLLARLPVVRGLFSVEASTRAVFYQDDVRRLQ